MHNQCRRCVVHSRGSGPYRVRLARSRSTVHAVVEQPWFRRPGSDIRSTHAAFTRYPDHGNCREALKDGDAVFELVRTKTKAMRREPDLLFIPSRVTAAGCLERNRSVDANTRKVLNGQGPSSSPSPMKGGRWNLCLWMELTARPWSSEVVVLYAASAFSSYWSCPSSFCCPCVLCSFIPNQSTRACIASLRHTPRSTSASI